MLKAEIRKFVEDQIARGQPVPADDASLIDAGLIDSIGLMRLMQFVEQRTSAKVPPSAVTPSNFESVDAIERFVLSLQPKA